VALDEETRNLIAADPVYMLAIRILGAEEAHALAGCQWGHRFRLGDLDPDVACMRPAVAEPIIMHPEGASTHMVCLWHYECIVAQSCAVDPVP